MSVLTRMVFPSRTLLRPVEVMAALPLKKTDAKLPVLWALHCAMEDGDFFFRYLDCARLAQHLGIAIIAPSLGNGFFLNTSYEPQGDFLEELANSLPAILNISQATDRNAVIGISMGGFGAIRWALSTSRFFAAGAISGAFDATLPPDTRVFGDEKLNFINQSFDALMRSRLADKSGHLPGGGSLKGLLESFRKKWPKLYLYCAGNDYLSLNQTEAFYQACKKLNAPCKMNRQIEGSHDLEYWKKAFPLAAKEIFSKPGEEEDTKRGGGNKNRL